MTESEIRQKREFRETNHHRYPHSQIVAAGLAPYYAPRSDEAGDITEVKGIGASSATSLPK